MPALYLGHGAPVLIDDPVWPAELSAWSARLPRPTSILIVSAHWESAPLTIGATTHVPLTYDFYGFPEKYYRQRYDSPGAPELAAAVRALMPDHEPVGQAPRRGLDHGAYVPLSVMYPEADIPVLQVSMPDLDPQHLFALGQRLAPLRDEGVLIVGSGFLTHNLGMVDMRGGSGPARWAAEFDAWCEDALRKRDVDLLSAYQEKAPNFRTALPTVEHFVPVLAALGASLGRSEAVSFPVTGFAFGSFTKRSVQFG